MAIVLHENMLLNRSDMKRHLNEDSEKDLSSTALFPKRLRICGGDAEYCNVLCGQQHSLTIRETASSALDVPIVGDYSSPIGDHPFMSNGENCHDPLFYCHDMATSCYAHYDTRVGCIQPNEHADSNFKTSNSILRELHYQREGRRSLIKGTLSVSDTCDLIHQDDITINVSKYLKFSNQPTDYSFAAVSNQQKFREDYERRLSTEDQKSWNLPASVSIDFHDDYANNIKSGGQRWNSSVSGLADRGGC